MMMTAARPRESEGTPGALTNEMDVNCPMCGNPAHANIAPNPGPLLGGPAAPAYPHDPEVNLPEEPEPVAAGPWYLIVCPVPAEGGCGERTLWPGNRIEALTEEWTRPPRVPEATIPLPGEEDEDGGGKGGSKAGGKARAGAKGRAGGKERHEGEDDDDETKKDHPREPTRPAPPTGPGHGTPPGSPGQPQPGGRPGPGPEVPGPKK